MKTISLLTFFFALMTSQMAFAQGDNCEDGWCWGSDVGTAKEKWTLFSDGITLKDYKTSENSLAWLLENTPNLNKALYIKAVNLYEDMLDAEEENGNDAAVIAKYQDKILALYDQRIEYFGEAADVLERKGKKAYFYLKDREDPEKWNKMYVLYDKVFENNKNETSGSNSTFLMLSAVNLKVRKEMTEQEVLAVYDRISEVLDYNIVNKKGSQQERWENIQDKIDGLLGKAVTINCDFVRENMGDAINNKPDDIKASKRALKYMINGKCTDDPLFLKAAENIYTVEPTPGLAATIGKIYQSNKEYDKAMEWKEKAIELAADNPEEQGKLYFELAQILSVQGKKSSAREKAYKAVEMDNSLTSSAYTLIGDLYFNSANDCSSSGDPVKAKANYMAAYDMYQKAGNSSRMSQAMQGFPTAAEIHMVGKKEGESVSVDCWIGGSTTVRKRPSDN